MERSYRITRPQSVQMDGIGSTSEPKRKLTSLLTWTILGTTGQRVDLPMNQNIQLSRWKMLVKLLVQEN